MDTIDLIKDALKYPIEDTTAFLKLAIPNLLVVIISMIWIGLTYGITNTRDMYLSYGVFSIIIIVLAFLVALFYSGLSIEIISRTINNSKQLPELNLNCLIDGIKFLIVGLVYLIPIIILTLLAVFIILLNKNLAVLGLIIAFITLIVGIIIAFALIIAMCRYAETRSISEAIEIKKIYEIAQKIGLGDFVITSILIGIIAGVVSFVLELIAAIPIIGLIIVSIATTYLVMYQARAYGLLYLEQKSQYSPYNQYNQYNNQIPPNNNQVIPPEESNRIDFQNNTEHREFQETIKCQVCG
ncbi:MAG: DUF4013 domain-containing protein, partial [Methanosphaera stadtmanae]|nr:DUF4013 domain-containing protein [Methanosphaera stadtmanae]